MQEYFFKMSDSDRRKVSVEIFYDSEGEVREGPKLAFYNDRESYVAGRPSDWDDARVKQFEIAASLGAESIEVGRGHAVIGTHPRYWKVKDNALLLGDHGSDRWAVCRNLLYVLSEDKPAVLIRDV